MTSAVPYAEVIGDPVAHSKSPFIHNHWLKKLGATADYRTCRVGPDELSAYLKERRSDPAWRGCNVTMPHKQAVIPLLDTVHRAAKAIGAVNTVRRDAHGKLHGRNTDLHGIWRSLDHVPPKGRSVLLVGAGGAARSAAYAMRQAEVKNLVIMTRDRSKGEALAEELFPGAEVCGFDADPSADLLINATPLGMAGRPWPRLPLQGLSGQATVFDMVYAPPQTELITAANQRGLRTVGGVTMLLFQAAEAFATFFNEAAPAETFDTLARECAA